MAPLVSAEARIGRNVSIGESTRVHDNVVIEDDVTIEDFCVIGRPVTGGKNAGAPLRIGRGSRVRSHTVLCEGSDLGAGFESGHHVFVRDGTVAGANLRIGSHSDVEGDCVIGDYARLHGYVHVGRGSRIGDFVWLFSQTTLANDPLPPSDASAPVTIGDGAVVCIGSLVMPGASLGKGAFVAAHSQARGVVPAGAVVEGPEGRIVTHVTSLVDAERGIRHPWMRHFRAGYPPEAIPRLERLAGEVAATRGDFLRALALETERRA